MLTTNVRQDESETGARAKGRRRAFVHQEVMDWLEDPRTDRQFAQRARLVLWQMLALGGPTQVKSVRGEGRGWLRTDLGGNHGHQFYLWWARPGSPPVRHLGLTRDELLVRSVRHHDETNRGLDPGVPGDWLPLGPSELEECNLVPELLPEQAEATVSRARIRLIRGQPGTGKTTVLWRAAVSAGARSVLYVTYSGRLAGRAEDFFRQFAPEGCTVRVTTFAALLDDLAAALPEEGGRPRPLAPAVPSVGPEDAAAVIAEALAAFGQRYAPWEGRLDDLHAELHAHYVGGALPEALRGAPACGGRTFDVEGYVALRRGVLGEKGARSAAKLGAFLRDRGTFAAVAPGPWRARTVLDALRAGTPLPRALADADAVFVDEAQDLTLVEAALLIELVARMGAAREAPEFVVAGDEGQTVRPTDFDWGAFADLVSARLAGPVVHELLGNVRSPRNLAAVVNRSWELYRGLARELRPRGRAEADIEEAVPGRIIRCRVPDDAAFERVAEAFRALPGAAFVYPGARLPAPYRTETFEAFTSDTAKGLDFAVVAVLDAGRQLAALRLRSAEGKTDRLDALQARTLADQLRVSLSRATDTLVLLDRGEDPAADAEIDRLCRDDGGDFLEGCLREMDGDDLVALLAREDATAEELVGEFLRDVRELLHDAPLRALERARRARGLLGRADSRCGVADLSLREEAMRLHGLAALRAALAVSGDGAAGRELYGEANKALHAAKHGAAARAALWLRDMEATPATAADDAEALLGQTEELAATVPELTRTVRDALIGWCARAREVDLPPGPTARARLADVVAEVAGRFGDEAPALAGHAEAVRLRVARALRAQGHAREALDQLRRLARAAPAEEAACFEVMGEYGAAADLHEQAGDPASALRCVRRIPDLDRALALARRFDSAAAEALAWAADLRDRLAERSRASAALSDEERAALRALFEAAVPPRSRARRPSGA